MAMPNPGMPEPIRPGVDAVPIPVRGPLAGRGALPVPATWRAAAPALPPALATGFDLMALLKALRRRWLVAFTLGLLAAGGALAGVYFFLPPRNTAFAQIYISSTNPRILLPTSGDGGRSDFVVYQNTQASRIKSRFVLNAALKRDEVRTLEIVQKQPDPVLWLEEELKVEFKEGSEVMTISMIGADAPALVAIVKAVTEEYLREVREEEPRRKSQLLAELEDILAKANLKLTQKKDHFYKLAEGLGSSDPTAVVQRQVGTQSTLGENRSQYAKIRGEMMRAEARLKQLQSQEKLHTQPDVPDEIVNEAVNTDTLVKEMLLRRAKVQNVVDHYKKTATDPNEPTAVRARESLAAIDKELKEHMDAVRKQVVKRILQKAASDYKITLASVQSEFSFLAEQEKILREEVEKLGTEARKIGNSSTELEMLRAEIAGESKTAEKVRDETEQLKVELRAPPRVRPYQDAGLQKQDIKRLLMAMVVAPGGALALVCFGVGWLEYRGRRIQSAEEVMSGLCMPVIGSVPTLAPAANRRLLGDAEQGIAEHGLLESIDGIRTLLLRQANVEATRVVLVTSAVSGEGKTTLASHLATSLARAGRKTLLIDSDLRRPAAHQLFELPLQPGLSEVLLGEVHLAEATRSTAVDGLWMIPAGQWDREVMHALARDGMDEIFEKLKSEYDFIVVDSHPVLPANDSLLIAQHVDAVLLAVLRDVSQAPRIYAACQKLATLGIRVLGAVVNGTKHEDCYAGYHYVPQGTKK